MALLTPIREDAGQRHNDDSVWWLALMLEFAVILTNSVRSQYALSRGSSVRSAGMLFSQIQGPVWSSCRASDVLSPSCIGRSSPDRRRLDPEA